MTALSAARNTPELALLATIAALEFTAKDGEDLWAGGIGCLDSNGEMVPASRDASLIPVGKIEKSVTGDGTVTCKAKPGVWRLTAGEAITAASIGDTVYLEDDQTVYLGDDGGNRPAAGTLVNVDDVGAWVAVGFQFFNSPAAAPTGMLHKKSVTVAYDDFTKTADGDDEDINVGTALPAGAILVGARYKILTPFVGAGLASLTMIVGKAGDTNGVIEAVDILGDAAGSYQGTLGTMMVNGPSLQDAVQLVANFDPDASGGLDELTAGEVQIDAYYFVAF